MDYVIDTNIAYYLLNYCGSKDKNFDLENFKQDKTSKAITSLSLLEIYLKVKKNAELYKRLMKELSQLNIGTLIHGNPLKNNQIITIKKLAYKSRGYITRTMKYIQNITLDEFANNIVYLGILIGGDVYWIN